MLFCAPADETCQQFVGLPVVAGLQNTWYLHQAIMWNRAGIVEHALSLGMNAAETDNVSTSLQTNTPQLAAHCWSFGVARCLVEFRVVFKS